MANKAKRSIVYVAELCRLFDCRNDQFDPKLIETFDHNGFKACYLDDFHAKLVGSGFGSGSRDLRDQELRERIRKLRLENDKEEGKLVWAADIAEANGRCFKAIADTLDTAIPAIRIAVPDLPQAALAAVQDCLADARNKAADIDFTALRDSEL